MANAMNQYEAMFLLGPIGATEPETGLNMCRQIIERHGGQIILIKKWEERKLAYELARQKRGTYILAFFRGPGTAVSSIERDVKLSEDVLRVMIMRADHVNEQEMAAMEPQRPEPREERPMGDRWGAPAGDRGPRPPRRDEPAAPSPEAAAKE